MADNVILDSMTGGDTVAADDIASVKYQRIKMIVGVDGTNDGDVSSSNPIPAILSANSGVDIGDVDVLTLPSDTFVAEGGALGLGVLLQGDDGTDRKNVNVDATTGDLQVDVTNTITETNSAAILADTASMDTNLATVAGAVTGTEMQVDVVAALPTGANAIGKLAANSGVDIGDVDVLSIIPGVGATNLGKAEDAVHSSGDTGIMSLAVRKDAVAAIAADGDYHPILISDMGAVWTEHIPNEVDSNNSSTSILGIDAVFTGTGVEVLNYDLVTVTVDASHDSATDGLSIQFSTDNSNWDDVYPFTYTAADGARRFQFPITARYFRVVYTNGGTGQSHFRLQTILHHGASMTSVHRLVDNVSNDRSSEVVKAAIIAQQGGGGPGAGDFIPVQATATGNLKISVEEYDTSLPAGTNTIGKLAANSGVDIGDVDVISIIPGVGATNLGKAEDAAHSSGDTGVMALAVQQTADAALAGTTGDYAPMQVDENGFLKVNIKAGAGSGGTSFTDDAAFTAGSSSGTPMMGFATSDAVDVGDVGVVAMDVNRNLKVSIEADSVGIGGGTQHAEDDPHTTGDVGTLALVVRKDTPANLSGADGDYEALQVSAGRVWASTVIDTALPAGSNAIGKLAANSGVDIGDVDILSLPGTVETDITAIKTATELIDDAIFADDAAFTLTSSKAMVSGAIRDDSLDALAAAQGDVVPLRVNSVGALMIQLNGGGTLDEVGQINNALPAGTNAIGKLAANSGVDIGDVDILGGTIDTLTSLVGSSIAHDAADSGNPHKFGGRAQEPTTAADEVADNDRTDALFDRQGRLAVWNGYAVKSADINDSTSGNNTIVAALGAGLRIAVIGCMIVSDGTTDVRWEDGAAGTAFTGQMPLQAREGFVLPIGNQPWFVGSAATLLNLELTAAINVHGIVSYVEMTD